jgi:ribosomal protein S18 acetylase RimI-like enzyme
MLHRGGSLAAIEHGVLHGFLGWYLVDGMRNTGRKGAYVPEWGHATLAGDEVRTYQALYRAASTGWAAAGTQVHAITLLASDRAAVEAWFWNGFGLAVVDAIRPMRPLDGRVSTDLALRKATLADVPELTVLDEEHRRHYTQPPVFMAPVEAPDFPEFLQDPRHSVWLALDGETMAGFIKFEGSSDGAAESVSSDTGIAITGAYVRPAYRGRGAAPALLDAALRDFAARGFERCTVDFESFNPEAASFWVKYFQPVCYSLMRVPET